MALHTWSDGDILYSADLNSNFSESLSISGKNLIRSLIDRSGVFSLGQDDFWGDAYVDSNGRENSVSSTDSVFDTNKYIPGFLDNSSSDTIYNPDSLSNPELFFDGDDSTYTSYIAYSTGGNFEKSLGKTFASKYIYMLKIHARSINHNGGVNNYIYLDTYDGSTWTNITTLASGTLDITYSNYYILDSTVSGIRIRVLNGGSTAVVERDIFFYELTYGEQDTTTITHTIPSGTFNSTISSAIGVPMISDWEDGADIQYKLTNASDDSGWLSCGNSPVISNFTAFTGEPTSIIVKLIPKTSGATNGYPSIKGFVVRGE